MQLSTLLVLTFLSILSWNQENPDDNDKTYFEGIITYDSFQYGMPEEVLLQRRANGLGDTAKTEYQFFYGEKFEKVVVTQGFKIQDVEFEFNDIVITSYTDSTQIKCSNYLSQFNEKTCCPKKMDPKGSFDEEVELLPGTMNILGYECKKAIVTNSFGVEMITYYTTEFPARKTGAFALLDGLALAIEMPSGPGTVYMIAISVEQKKLESNTFEAPSDYEMKDRCE